MLESLFSQDDNFIKKRLQHRCFPVKFAKFIGAPVLKDICELLLLEAWNKNDNEHYSRRSCICIHDAVYDENDDVNVISHKKRKDSLETQA